MGAGRYRHTLTIQSATETQDTDFGDVTEVWSTFLSLPGWAVPSKNAVQGRISGEEGFTGDRYVAERSAQFGVRYSSDAATITEKMRIVFGSDTYEIYGIYHDERQRELVMLGSMIRANV